MEGGRWKVEISGLHPQGGPATTKHHVQHCNSTHTKPSAVASAMNFCLLHATYKKKVPPSTFHLPPPSIIHHVAPPTVTHPTSESVTNTCNWTRPLPRPATLLAWWMMDGGGRWKVEGGNQQNYATRVFKLRYTRFTSNVTLFNGQVGRACTQHQRTASTRGCIACWYHGPWAMGPLPRNPAHLGV